MTLFLSSFQPFDWEVCFTQMNPSCEIKNTWTIDSKDRSWQWWGSELCRHWDNSGFVAGVGIVWGVLGRGEKLIVSAQRYHCFYPSVEEHHRKNVPWKAWLFKCLHILDMTCNSLKKLARFLCLCSPIYIILCTVVVTLPRLGQIPEPCSTHQYLYARWSTFSGRFHTVSFTMQSHDQNSTLSLRVWYPSMPCLFRIVLNYRGQID